MNCLFPAKRFIQGMNFVAATPSARDALGDVLERHREGIRAGGERACLHVKGASLDLESVTVRQTGYDMTPQIRNFLQGHPLYLAREASVIDCASVLR